MLLPMLPEPGAEVTILGITAKVLTVEPQNDWCWAVTLSSVSILGAAEVWTIELPTDFRTDDGRSIMGRYFCAVCGKHDEDDALDWSESFRTRMHDDCERRLAAAANHTPTQPFDFHDADGIDSERNPS